MGRGNRYRYGGLRESRDALKSDVQHGRSSHSRLIKGSLSPQTLHRAAVIIIEARHCHRVGTKPR
jgi:hypothetical protein